MADWIKVETISSQKIEVLTMADILDMDEHMVFGKLVILWCWADANTVDGNAQNVTKRMIDRVACSNGFADAMLDKRVGWLKEDEDGNLSFSNFDRHNGKGAKKRATTARRVKEHRANVMTLSDKSNADNVTNALPDKKREDKNRIDKEKEQRIKDAFDEFWSSYHNKKSKPAAERAFKAAIKREGIKDLSEFVGKLIKDCKAKLSAEEFGFDRLHASTYLNNNRWEDSISLTESQNKTENSISSGYYDGYRLR